MLKKQMDEKAECIKHGACMQSKNGVLEGKPHVDEESLKAWQAWWRDCLICRCWAKMEFEERDREAGSGRQRFW